MNRTVNQHKNSLAETHKRVLLERLLQGNYPPHLLIAFAFHKIIGWPAERMVAEFYQKPLSVVEGELEKQLIKEGFEDGYVRNLFQPLRLGLEKPLNLIRSKQFKNEYKPLLTEIAGTTKLSDYFRKEPETAISEYWDSDTDLLLIADAIQNKPGAFERLYRTVEEQARGFICFKMGNDKKVKDLARETQREILEKLSVYNPAFRPFIAFVKNRAWFLINRYWKNIRNPREVSLDELKFEFPGLDDEETPAKISSRTAANASESQPLSDKELNEKLRLYGILWKVTFRCPVLPHLLITFSFNKLLGEKPASIVAGKSKKFLQKLGELLEEELILKSQLPEDFIRARIARLYQNLEKTFEDFQLDPRAVETLPPLRGRKIGQTVLKEYYRIDPLESNIPMWSQLAQRKVQQCLVQYLRATQIKEIKNNLL